MSGTGRLTSSALNKSERYLLEWLANGDGQYGECHGSALDALLARGLAEIKQGFEHQFGFIAKGESQMHQAVAITPAGRLALEEADG